MRTAPLPRPPAWRALVFVAGLAGSFVAREAAGEDAPAPPRAPLTSLESGPLARSQAVVVGRLVVLVPGDGASPKVARLDVEKTLWGRVDGAAATVFIGGTRNTADARRPSEDYLRGRREGRYVLFLSRTPNASGYAVESLIDADGDGGREKAEVLERELAILALPDDERAPRMLAHLVGLLAARTPWSRQHAARELDLLSAARPDLFTDAVRAEVAAQRRRTFDAVARARLDRVLGRTGGAEAGPPPVTPPPESAAPRPPPSPPPAAAPAPPSPSDACAPDLQRARRRLAEPMDPAARRDLLTEVSRLARGGAEADLLAAFESSPDAIVRERAAVLLGDVGARRSLPRLVARFDREADPAVREAVVRAAGLLGDEGVVPWLLARLGEPALVRATAFALARVRTGKALDALEGLRVLSLRADPPDDAMAALVVYLRGAAFVERERVLGREVGPRDPLPGPAPGATDGTRPPELAPEDARPR